MKSLSLFDVTTVEFSLFVPLFSLLAVAYMVVLWLFYVYKSRNLFNSFIQYKLKNYKELKSSENYCARKKDFSMIHEN